MESSLAFMDDLLDFSSDIGGEDEEDDAVPPFSVKPKAATDSSEFNAGFHPEDSSSCRVLPVSPFFRRWVSLFRLGCQKWAHTE